MRYSYTSLFLIFFLSLSSNTAFSQTCEGGTSYSWDDDIAVIFSPCTGCHGGTSGLSLDSYAGISAGGNNCGTDLLTGTYLIDIITSTGTTCPNGNVGPSMNNNCGGCIDATELSAIGAWINGGAPEVCAILPVQYTQFAARANQDFVQIYWTTVTEVNSDRFDIYHSVDLANYDLIGSIDAAGNSTQENHYDFIHETPAIGTNYYRLIQTDFDGTEHVSKYTSIRFTGDLVANLMQVFPNPVQRESNFVMEHPISDEYTVSVFDIFNKLIFQKTIAAGTDQRMVPIDLHSEPEGTYLLTMHIKNELVFTSKLMKLR